MSRRFISRRVIVLILAALLLASCTTTSNTVFPTMAPELPSATSTAATTATAQTTIPATTFECPDADGPLDGAVVFVGDGQLFAMDGNGNNVAQLTTLPTTQWAQHPVWSPDAQALAYTLYGQNPDTALNWLPLSMICALDRATGEGRVLAQPDARESLSEGTWTADGAALLVSRARHELDANNQYLGTKTEIARYDLGGSAITTIASDASSAALSPDGKHLAYVYNNPLTFELQLMLAAPDGTNPQVVRGPGEGFGTAAGLSWSADSTKLVFAASGGETARQSPRRVQTALEWLVGVEVAQAHGAPMDIWTVDAGGTNLRRITEKNYDDPRPTWSPDGQQIAILTNGGGIILLNVADGTEQQLTEQGNLGGITWASP